MTRALSVWLTVGFVVPVALIALAFGPVASRRLGGPLDVG